MSAITRLVFGTRCSVEGFFEQRDGVSEKTGKVMETMDAAALGVRR